jgi:hypothetical protein
MGGRPSVESCAVKTARIQQPIGRRRDSINRLGGCSIDRLSRHRFTGLGLGLRCYCRLY